MRLFRVQEELEQKHEDTQSCWFIDWDLTSESVL